MGGTNKGVKGAVLIISSSRSVMQLVARDLGFRRFGAVRTCSKGGTFCCLGRGGVSFIILSVVVPRVSNFRIYQGVEDRCGVPVLLLDTHDESVSGVVKLRVKTSSCVAGPFDVRRLASQVGTRFEGISQLRRR